MIRISEFSDDGWGFLSLDWIVLTAVLMMTAASVMATGAVGIDVVPVGSAAVQDRDAGAAFRRF